MLSAKYVDVKVMDSLATLFTVVNYCSVATCTDSFLFCNFGNYDHEVAKKCCMSIFSFANACQTITVFRDYQEVDFCLRGYIFEGKAEVVFVKDGCRNFFFYDSVENCDINWSCSLCFCLFVFHFYIICNDCD